MTPELGETVRYRPMDGVGTYDARVRGVDVAVDAATFAATVDLEVLAAAGRAALRLRRVPWSDDPAGAGPGSAHPKEISA